MIKGLRKELEPFSRDILVTGHPRSGTGYCAKLLQHNGLDVPHEQIGGMGTSNWQFAVDSKNIPFSFDGIQPIQCNFIHRIQIVRNPVDCIASVFYTEHGSEYFRDSYLMLTGNKMERAVRSVITWNTMHKDRADLIFKLEQPEQLLEYLKGHGYLDTYEVLTEPVNTRPHDGLDLEHIRAWVAPEIYGNLLNFIAWYKKI